ncbi:uncharacterized protein [Lolium perenne]|uniref:uncharacterized protein isoform X2 n=1 Tax=Lolium perenne TaxID=4522 RepID=UPI0021F697AB|nr:uncharacterized protein LOC127343676 isoform X2 [Lolium perenne]
MAAAEPFSIRGFAARMRAEDADKCWLLGGRAELETETSLPLPPMDPPPRSRWWAHELAAVRARPDACAAGGDAAVGGGAGNGGGLGRTTRRKGSRGSAVAERANKRQRVLQLKYKELLRKHKGCTVRTLREFVPRKKLQERQDDHISVQGDSLKKQCGTGIDHKRSIKASRPTNHPLNHVCEVVEHVTYPPKDDIFGDLPLLESSKIMFRTGVDILPTVIEDSFLENQNGADALSETEQLKLIPTSDISKLMPPPLEDLVKKDQTPDKESTCISPNDAGRSHSFSAKFDGPLNHTSVTMEKACLAEMQLKSTDVPALSSYCKDEAKSGSSKPSQGCLYMNTDCFQEIKLAGISSATVRTRTEATNKDRDSSVCGKKSTYICGRLVPSDFYTNTDCFQKIERTGISLATVRMRTEAINKDRDPAVRGKKSTDVCDRLVPSEHHLSREGTLLSVVSQGTAGAGINTDAISPCRKPAKEYAFTSGPCKFASNIYHESRKSVDTCKPLSMDDQGSWYSKVYPGRSPASGLPFMKLPGLERMEISSYDPRTGENNFMNGQIKNTIRCKEQQPVSGMASTIQGQNNIGFSDSQAGKKALDGFVTRDSCHSHQPTMRLMGRIVSVCKSSKEQELSTEKGLIDSSIFEGDRPSAISCELPPKRLFPFKDSVLPRARILESSDTLPRIPNSTSAQARPIINDAQNHSLQQTNNVSSTFKDCAWNSGSQFGWQTQVNKESTIGVNYRTRHSELYQPPTLTSIPRNQYFNLSIPGSGMHTEDHTFVRSAVNQSCTSFPQWPLNMSMQGKYQKSTSSSYEDLRSVPTHQPYQVPGANLFSTPIIYFHDCGTNSAESRNFYQPGHPSLTANLASKSISALNPMCAGSLLNIDGRKGVPFVDQTSKRPACADNVSQQPAKRQVVANKLEELTSQMFPNMKNYSSGWSLNDAVGPRILDFSNKLSRNTTQISKSKNNNLGDNSVPVVEAGQGL